MIVVTTPTGQIGRELVRLLLEQDEKVRVIARDPARLDDSVRDRVEVVQGSHDDPAVLDQALAGAAALFWLVPPDRQAPSAMEHYLRFARAGAAAVARQHTGQVVGVSSAGHGWPKPAGVLTAAFAMDAELRTSGAAYRALALPYYMENLLGQADAIQAGSFTLTCAGDRPLASIATRDIAAAAARLLTDRSWTGQENLPVYGPGRLTPDDMAEIMSAELGQPVVYRRTGLDDFAARLRSAGAPEQTVTDVTEMLAAQDDGLYDADWAVAAVGATDFRTWCREVLAPAVTSEAAPPK